MAKIGFQSRQYYLGTFNTLEDAIAVREEAETLLFESFLKEYRTWEKFGEEGEFHFDTDRFKSSLSELKFAER